MYCNKHNHIETDQKVLSTHSDHNPWFNLNYFKNTNKSCPWGKNGVPPTEPLLLASSMLC